MNGVPVPIPPSPGSHLASDLWWQKIWSGIFSQKKMTWIQERDRIHWQYVCIICIHTWNPNDSNDSSFVSEKTVGWILKGKSFWSLSAHRGGLHHVLAAHALGHLVSFKASLICTILGKYHLAFNTATSNKSAVLQWTFCGSKLLLHDTPRYRTPHLRQSPGKESLFVDYW